MKVSVIVGGTEEGIDRGRPLLMAMGAIRCEEAGTRCIATVTFAVGETEEGMGHDLPLFKAMEVQVAC